MSERKKILFVVHSLATGGIERVLCTLCRRLDPLRFHPSVCCLVEEGEGSAAFHELGVPVTVLDGVSSQSPRHVLRNGRTLTRLIATLRALRPHVVQAEMFYAGTLGRFGALLSGIPLVYHGVHNYYPWKGLIHRLTDRFLAACTSGLVVPTRAVANYTERQEGVPQSSFHIVANGVSPPGPHVPDRGSARRRLGLESSAEVVVFCARLVAQKRPDFAVDVFEGVARHRPQARLLVVGDGPLRGKVEERVASLGLADRVTLCGRVEDPYPYLRAADVFLAPSEREGFGIAAGEALLAGAAVLLSDIAPFREVYGDLGPAAFVTGSSVEDWSSALARLLDARDLCGEMVRTGESLIETRYTPEAMVEGYARLYAR